MILKKLCFLQEFELSGSKFHPPVFKRSVQKISYFTETDIAEVLEGILKTHEIMWVDIVLKISAPTALTIKVHTLTHPYYISTT